MQHQRSVATKSAILTRFRMNITFERDFQFYFSRWLSETTGGEEGSQGISKHIPALQRPEKCTGKCGGNGIVGAQIGADHSEWSLRNVPMDVTDPKNMIHDHWEVGWVNIRLWDPEKCPKWPIFGCDMGSNPYEPVWWTPGDVPTDMSDPNGMIYDHWEVRCLKTGETTLVVSRKRRNETCFVSPVYRHIFLPIPEKKCVQTQEKRHNCCLERGETTLVFFLLFLYTFFFRNRKKNVSRNRRNDTFVV